ncbi:MAG: glutamate-1-semialdehyde 2,1-aminomutase [Candidatus Marinimicrobia bacterium]|nr:glutamate-1-semialdehyde 2,1-aminomutase [Candidatus Neomarinimicrobiota bacterium]
MNKIHRLVDNRHNLIPGGAHTYSKGDDQFPDLAPKVIARGKGAYVWDLYGHKFLDWCMGLRSVSLGHVYKTVNDAVVEQMEQGNNFGRPHLVEFELADLLVQTIPFVEMVKFAKNGSNTTTAAVKLSRAYTGRKYVAVCKDHPFFSFDDWFIGTTSCSTGVPKEVRNLSLTFGYNNAESLEKLFKKFPGQIACVIMEVVTTEKPKGNFLKDVQDLCRKNGAVFILDEMITGFRWHLKGAAYCYGLEPDLVTYGKGIANGYSVSVIGGKKEIMELGGIYHTKSPKVFLTSTTHGAETISLRAAIATIKEIHEKGVPDHFWRLGSLLKDGLEKKIKDKGLTGHIQVAGFAPNLSMVFKNHRGDISMPLKTLFLQEVVRRGILFQGYFAISYSHNIEEIIKTLEVFDRVFDFYAPFARGYKNWKEWLVGEPVKPVFRKEN